jgi:uncharacterized protein YhaN
MRINKLSLDLFGQFTSKSFDFRKTEGSSDFHIIYGPNEAGKTTIMEGYLRLLYGFQTREPYGFKHQRPNLQISSVLELNGEAHSFTRLPSRNGNLRNDSGGVLPEAAIASHLGGLSLEDYRRLLCLDDETIEKGGKDIANAQGDIGRLLFSAASGVADLNAVLEQVRAEASELYKKGGSKNRVATLKRDLTEVEQRIKDIDVNASAWQKLKGAFQVAENEVALAKADRDALRLELTQISAMHRTLPKIGEVERLLCEIEGYADYPEKIDVDTEGLFTLKTEQEIAQAECERLTEEIEKNQHNLGELILDEDRLSLAVRLNELDVLRSRMQTAVQDLPQRRGTHKEVLAVMTRIARELGAAEGIDPMNLVKSPAEITKLESLRDAMDDANRAKQAEESEVNRLQKQVIAAQKEHQSLLNDVPTQTGLIKVLSGFDVHSLISEVATAKQELSSSNENLWKALNALAVDSRTYDDVPHCPIDQTTADDLAKQYADLENKINIVHETILQHEKYIVVETAKIAKRKADTGIVSDEEAYQVREQRDTLWQDHRDRLTVETADAFESSMKQVDDIDGARFVHARELGQLRQMEQALTEAKVNLATTQKNLDEFRSQAEVIEKKVDDLATKIGLPKLSPTRFRDWVGLRDYAANIKQVCEKLAGQHSEILNQEKQLYESLLPLLPLESPNFEVALKTAQNLAEQEQNYKGMVRAAFDKKVVLEKQLEDRRQDLVVLEESAKQANETWNSKVHELFERTLLPDILVDSIAQLRNIRESDTERQQIGHRISAMEEDQYRFVEAITVLNEEFGIDESDPLKAFRMLENIASQAQADKERYDDLSKKIAKDEEECKKIQTQLQQIDLQVTNLGALFPETADTSTLDALRITVGKATNIIQKRTLIAELEKQIFSDLSVDTLAESCNMIGEETAATLDAKTISLRDDLKLADTRLSDAIEARTNAQHDLKTVSGSAEIAELRQQRMTLQIEIKDTLLNYVERDFGLRLAEEAIRRYRDKHRSGMMDATERAFLELTNSAYQKLQTQPDGLSETLLAFDSNGTSKQIDDMSKGTRFQLYLALRAAAYEQMVSQGVQLPFFCDDVFETFDDDRTRAACRLMERIGRSGQAIYLTHHRHVVEIAKEVCDIQPSIHTIEVQ